MSYWGLGSSNAIPPFQFVRPELVFKVVRGDEPPQKSPEESRWWKEAQAEVDAICTSLKDFYADTR